MEKMQKKAAFVAIVGRPSAGKSTLVNALCGEKVAIVSAAPQTTRNAIRGIVNREQGQLVLVDTPGRHTSEKKFNQKLLEVSNRALADTDLALYVLDASRPPGPEEIEIASLLAPVAEKTIAAINKIDLPDAHCEPAEELLRRQLPSLGRERCLRISAKTTEGLSGLLDALFARAPEGAPFYDEEYYTDQETCFRIAEIIREQAINRLRQELPYSLYVDIADAEFSAAKNRLWVRAFIIVERESQKGMVVGKGGAMIKAIRLAALKSLRALFDWNIELDLRVKTGKDWRHNDAIIHKIVDCVSP